MQYQLHCRRSNISIPVKGFKKHINRLQIDSYYLLIIFKVHSFQKYFLEKQVIGTANVGLVSYIEDINLVKSTSG